ncbi:hypothetical protein D3C81_1883480 [compost metagenome]
MGWQRHIGREQRREHQLGQQGPAGVVESLKMQRQLLHLEAGQGCDPGAGQLVEPMIQGWLGIHEDQQLQALAVGQPIRGLLAKGELGRDPGEGGLRQQGAALGVGDQQQLDLRLACHHLVKASGLDVNLGREITEGLQHRKRPHP